MFDQTLDQNIVPLVLGTDCPLQIASGNRVHWLFPVSWGNYAGLLTVTQS